MHVLRAIQNALNLTLSVVLSGAVSAIVAAIISMFSAKRLDTANKEWALQAELRKFRVNRIATATNGLRRCFFTAKTQLEFNLMAVIGFENEFAMLSQMTGLSTETYERRLSALQLKEHAEIVHFNDRVGVIQAEAKSHASILIFEPLLQSFSIQLQGLMAALAQEHLATSESVRERIAVFEERQSTVVTLLNECDQLIADEIAKPL